MNSNSTTDDHTRPRTRVDPFWSGVVVIGVAAVPVGILELTRLLVA